MKKTVFLICFIFVANAFAGIVATADNANKFTKKAEADLTSFLTMISGEKCTAVPEKNLKKSGEKVIYLGDTAFARSKNIKTSEDKISARIYDEGLRVETIAEYEVPAYEEIDESVTDNYVPFDKYYQAL